MTRFGATKHALSRQYATILLLAAVYLCAGSFVQNSYYQLIMTLVLIWAALGLSWNMLSGYSGLISFGHAAFFGLGGYTMTIAFAKFGITPWLGIPLGVAVGMLSGVIIGVPTFRLRGHYFALSMLAYPLAMLYVFQWLGYQEVSLPMMREAPAHYAEFTDQRVYMALALGLLVVCMIVSMHVERSRFGLSMTAIKQNEPAASAAGINPLRWKLLAMSLSAAMGAAAGGLYAIVLLVVTPQSMFGALVSAQALILALFGGVGTFWGPVIGAAILVPLAELLNAKLGTVLPGIQGVIYGAAIIVIILVAPEGIYWRLRDYFASWSGAGARLPEAISGSIATLPSVQREAWQSQFGGDFLLELVGVSRAFGGLKAVDDVSLQIRAGTIHGVIGPNGAGKTTLFNVVNGFLAANSGRIKLGEVELTGLKPHEVCAQGVGRTFQVVRAFPRMTVLQNVIAGAYVGARSDAQAERLAVEALHRVGLADSQTHVLAASLTTKQLRLMELARALAPRPRLLLLDETLAGLSHDALDEILSVLRQINRDGVTIVIIEHTMHAMVRLVEQFSVLDHGKLIAAGSPSEVVRNPIVIEAYLGKKWMNRVKDQVA
jgi:ABC-type branched-subunit amino acid transport system ATPase component/ABC-type branched-subunit amino acid transport system permease subunit